MRATMLGLSLAQLMLTRRLLKLCCDRCKEQSRAEVAAAEKEAAAAAKDAEAKARAKAAKKLAKVRVVEFRRHSDAIRS